MSTIAEAKWRRSPWSSVGAWLIVIAAILMAVNTIRAFHDPSAFAAYMGLPLADPANSGFVLVYALRAALLALAALTFLLRAEITALASFAAVAVVMPVGDAVLTAEAGAPLAIVGRHAATAIYLAVTAYLLHRWAHANNARKET